MYKPHYRVTCIGRLGGQFGGEMFSWGFALARFENLGADALFEPNAAVWTDVANDCANFFGHADMGIHQDAVLQLVKVAQIGADGKYTAAPAERLVNQAGPGQVRRMPNQVAVACTLRTPGDLGRVRGRFYLPIPVWEPLAEGRYPQAVVEAAEGRLDTFVNNINNQPGIDVMNLKMAVASQGRRNKDGSIRVPADNHEVTQVSVGRVPDTIRRRRNKLSEAHTFTSV